MNKIYFPNLNALRFIAATLVIVHHVEQFKQILGFNNYFNNPFIKTIGRTSVLLFFVLSGYLITYLLLTEKKVSQNINITNFYIRRILRIWPLYFIILALSFFLLPNIQFFDLGVLSDKLNDRFWIKLLYFVFFLPNLALAVFPIIPFASQLWSVGYEEQFYLVWPILIKTKQNKTKLFAVIIVVFLILKISVYTVLKDYLIQEKFFKSLEFFFEIPSVDCMVIGAWFAYLLFQKDKVLKWLFHKNTQTITYILLVLFIGNGVFIPFLNTQLYSVLFGITILNLSANQNTILNLENKVTNFLGKISFGIYMYHTIVIVLVLKSLSHFNIHNVILENLISILLTITISHLSYQYIEERIIKLKSKF